MEEALNIINKLNIYKDSYVVLACSYGPDSMCLLDLLRKCNLNIVVAHVNHNFRFESKKEFIDLKYNKELGEFWFANDPSIADKEFGATYPRDNIKHRLYKKELEIESISIYGNKVCYLIKKPYKVLVASHIVPFKYCMKEGGEAQAYDHNNGLLLSQLVDSYFDKFEITFDDDGSVITAPSINKEVCADFEKCKLDKEVLNSERKGYLIRHRKIFFEKQKV